MLAEGSLPESQLSTARARFENIKFSALLTNGNESQADICDISISSPTFVNDAYE